MPTTVTAVTEKGTPITLNLSDSPGPSPPTEAAGDTARIAETLFILDRFGVSDECYHELAQVLAGLYICRFHYISFT